MAMCNFPELLALDLDAAESLFASKRMTVGAPRHLDDILESKGFADQATTIMHDSDQPLMHFSPHNFIPLDTMASLSQAPGHSRSRSTPQATLSSAEGLLSQPASTMTTGEDNNVQGNIFIARSKQSFSAPLCAVAPTNSTSDWDTDSIDSFELPTISLSRGASAHKRQQQQQKLEQQKKLLAGQERETSFDEADNRGALRSDQCGDIMFRDSCFSYGSLYDSYGYADDANDSTSVSSFGTSVPTADRARKQSVATTATSVTSSGCRFSSQSRTLSAMGPFSPVLSQKEFLPSCERHVEFNLENNAINGEYPRHENLSSVSQSSRSSRDSQKCSSKAASEATENTDMSDSAPCVASVTEERGRKSPAARCISHVPHSSWLIFDDDDKNEAEITAVPDISSISDVAHSCKDNASIVLATRENNPAFSPAPLPPRPRTSTGLSGHDKPDFSSLSDWASTKRLSRVAMDFATPVTSIPVPQRRSSLNQGRASGTLERNALLFHVPENSEDTQGAYPKPVLPTRDTLAVLDTAPDFSVQERFHANSRQFRRDLHITQELVSPTTTAFPESASPGHEHLPILLQRTVYRDPDFGFSHSGVGGVSFFAQAANGHDPVGQNMADETGSGLANEKTTQRSDDRAAGLNGSERLNQMTLEEPLFRSHFDEDTESEQDGNASDGDDDLFGDFDNSYNYDEGQDKILMATVVPFSRQLPRSLRSLPSMRSLPGSRQGGPAGAPAPQSPTTIADDDMGEAGPQLASWDENSSEKPKPPMRWPPAGDYSFKPKDYAVSDRDEGFFEGGKPNEVQPDQRVMAPMKQDDETLPNTAISPYHLEESLQKSQPIPCFQQPGIVGIPLPREVVDTLRVSVSCFPETMLSLSSFSIQTIRSYSHKVRRCNQSDADSTLRLLMSPSMPLGTLPSPAPGSPFSPTQLPPSPATASSHGGSMEFGGGGLTRSATGSTASPTTPRRFWKLSARLTHARTTSNLNLFSTSKSMTNAYDLSPSGPPTPRHSGRRRGFRTDDTLFSSADEEQSSASGLCLKRIFPTGSEYLCDALYAHIVAFNYISLLCPPLAAAAQPGSTAPASRNTQRLETAPHTISETASASTTFETPGRPQRQTIRIYVGSDVHLPTLSHFASMDSMSQGRMTPASSSRLERNSMLMSPSSTPPPSRGHADEDQRFISRKAALLLGISETLEPDSHKPLAELGSEASGSNLLVRRYNSLRRRRQRTGASISESTTRESLTSRAAAASKMIKSALPGSRPQIGDISRPIYETDTITESAAVAQTFLQPTTPVAPTPAAASATSDASLRDLHAGLHACISQLVATLKLTTGQLGNTLLNAEAVREIDPLFLRTLCELVRSQEELI